MDGSEAQKNPLGRRWPSASWGRRHGSQCSCRGRWCPRGSQRCGGRARAGARTNPPWMMDGRFPVTSGGG
uniref:Uncharacterized protein n=1 Tax=Triticum urartu TaxID=4572 RepID=A0A8R7PZ42_TRIUA